MPHTLFFFINEKEVVKEQVEKQIRTYLSKTVRIRKITCYKDAHKGAIVFQKKEDKDNAPRNFSTENYHFRLSKNASGELEKEEMSLSGMKKGETASLSGEPIAPNFFNPYHFVSTNGYTPRYAHSPLDCFKDNCGKIVIDLEFTSPGFVPDSERTHYIISDDTLCQEDDDETFVSGNIHAVLEAFSIGHKTREIRFDPDCRGWDAAYPPERYVKGSKDTSEDVRKWQEGHIRKFKDSGKYYIETTEPNRWAHKVMDFFQINGKPAIPGTSIKGVLRSRIETLSNACFPGYEDLEDDTSHMFHRLDVTQVHRSELRLEPVVLREWDSNTWEYVKVDHAKILSPHIFNRIGAKGESELAVYRNYKGYFEKISVTGKNEGPRTSTGLYAYDWKKRRGEIRAIADKKEIKTDNYSVIQVKSDDLSHRKNQCNKTFPFAKESPNEESERIWAIIRCKTERFRLFKIKRVSNNLEELKRQLHDFTDPSRNSDAGEADVSYKISEIRIKTAFDMDTKTQHQAFFMFGETDFDAAVNQRKAARLTEQQVSQFRSLLQQRKVNAEKLPRDPENINKQLAEELPDNLQHGMLAFWHRRNRYLTYTTVPQKPYRYSHRDILRNQDKLACNQVGRLCPACQLFGTAALDQEHPNLPAQKLTAVRGKVSVSGGVDVSNVPDQREWATLRPLSTPKPTYYPFYIMENHGSQNDNRPFEDYDSEDIHIGRKVYLHHPSDHLNYKGSGRTNLNSTIRPIPEGSCFKFEITFTNLTNYELGLLLYSLNMCYKGEKTGCHIGMGKPLGLGSCRISLKEVMLMNPSEYYADISKDGKTVLLPENENENKEIRKAEMLYQYVQGAETSKEFDSRLAEVNAAGLMQTDMPEDENIEAEYLSRKHIHEYHILSSINVHSTKYRINLPVIYAGGMDEAFSWYAGAKKSRERLFIPKELENDFSDGGQRHSLSSEINGPALPKSD